MDTILHSNNNVDFGVVDAFQIIEQSIGRTYNKYTFATKLFR